MRFSGGHDYYDTALGLGRDETLFFERSPQEKALVIEHKVSGFASLPPKALDFPGPRSWQRASAFVKNGLLYGYLPLVVYFGGKRYAGVKMVAVKEAERYSSSVEEQVFWEVDALKDHLDALGAKLFDDRHKLSSRISLNANNLDAFFDTAVTKAETDWMIDNRVSIAIFRSNLTWDVLSTRGPKDEWIINSDGLDKLKFAKALDPFQAFQNLSQWVGGVLSGEGRPMVKIADEKVILGKHGFDKKSFKHRD